MIREGGAKSFFVNIVPSCPPFNVEALTPGVMVQWSPLGTVLLSVVSAMQQPASSGLDDPPYDIQ